MSSDPKVVVYGARGVQSHIIAVPAPVAVEQLLEVIREQELATPPPGRRFTGFLGDDDTFYLPTQVIGSRLTEPNSVVKVQLVTAPLPPRPTPAPSASTGTALSADDQSWYAALCDRSVFPIVGEVIHASRAGATTTTSRIFMRQAYVDLIDLIYMIFQEPNKPRVIVRGSPGSGKTVFAAVMIKHFHFRLFLPASDPNHIGAILYDEVSRRLERTNIVCIRKDSITCGSIETFKAELHDPTSVYICDADSSGEPLAVSARTLVVSSPDPAHYKFWLKNSVLAKALCMPCWSLEEAEQCRLLCHPSQAEVDLMPEASRPSFHVPVSREELASRFALFGGVARYLFSSEERLDGYKASLLDAISVANLSELITSAKRLKSDNVGISSEIGPASLPVGVNHMLLQYTATPGKYRHGPIRFSSQWVVCRLLERQQAEGESVLVHYIKEAAGIADGLRGDLFERYAHLHLPCGGTFTMHQLDPYQKLAVKTLEVRIPACTLTQPFHLLPQLTAESLAYCRPRVKNQPAIDSVITPNIVTQITVSGRHDVSLTGLHAAVDALRATFKDAASQLNFVFVCESEADAFRIGTLDAPTKPSEPKGAAATAEAKNLYRAELERYKVLSKWPANVTPWAFNLPVGDCVCEKDGTPTLRRLQEDVLGDAAIGTRPVESPEPSVSTAKRRRSKENAEQMKKKTTAMGHLFSLRLHDRSLDADLVTELMVSPQLTDAAAERTLQLTDQRPAAGASSSTATTQAYEADWVELVKGVIFSPSQALLYVTSLQ